MSETEALSGEYLTFLCHECSDINSSSGEACVLRARVEDKVAVFKLGCVKGYEIPEEMRQAEIEYYARRVKRAKALKEFRLREAIEEAHAITTLAANCTNETDPLRRIGWVR